jgi:hypothetical protein
LDLKENCFLKVSFETFCEDLWLNASNHH